MTFIAQPAPPSIANLAPKPTGTSDYKTLFYAAGQAAVTPAGGTWAWHLFGFNASNQLAVVDAGVNAGGATVAGTSANNYVLLCWKIG